MVPTALEGLGIRDLATTSPHTFAAWASGGAWKQYPHLRYVSNVIRAATRTPGSRLLINMPPRVGKSLFLSKWLPIWFLESWPSKRCLLCAHGADLGAVSGRQIRNEIATNPRLRVKMSDDSKAADQWHTSAGGGMKTGGVGSGITGFGGDLCLLDDPYPTWQAAYSHTYRQTLSDWWRGTFLDRVEPGGTIVVLHHRWHPDDLTGEILRGEDGARWTHVRLPAFAEPGDPMGRKVGEPLCPERYSAAEWEATRLAVGPHQWAAKYQQAPTAIGQGMVYPSFDEANIDPKAELVPGLPLCVAFDFNINPGMHALVSQYDTFRDRFAVVREIHGDRMNLGQCLDVLAKYLAERPKLASGRLEVYADASGGAAQVNHGDSALALIRQRLTALGLSPVMLVPKANPPVTDRIAAMNDALVDQSGARHLFVHPSCTRLLTDFRELRLDAAGEIDKAHRRLSHASDALGYQVAFVRPAGGRLEIPSGQWNL